ncbi:2-oxo-4-hydroxy-4-carboxy-5-ureidoimidazoline decarboxylase [Streptomyces calidiresistens]|uniref:2-oxo-4-hydroxy-4-carboxy-5-ureidoimidazoline decarboxylase n=1 Tax=Streptomyces calidiresistens TaxID=1485586 RepID=A0A7W3T4E4_9ACTN|nr:2-oxo-4-hydroxy-4-carboxy-5-ureidoimidazoline decarboxylase [Streptomyces calidiresistens]MBB0230441.1 2-oxo-4-hydroxy-4-carboxy-5-ureidoimidazoline decarboxylase [Streptomyces calidiresistens]
MTTSVPGEPPGLDDLPEERARALLRGICAAEEWVDAVLAARPLPTAAEACAASDAAVAALSEEGLDRALAGHPPIGRPRPGDPVSAREQRGTADAPPALRAELLELNAAYRERFGHVFLIRATGRTAEQMRDALRARLANPPPVEREVTRAELAAINRLRLDRLYRQPAARDAVTTVTDEPPDTAAPPRSPLAEGGHP